MKKLYKVAILLFTIIALSVLVTTSNAAELTFLVVHPGDGTSYTKSSSTITWTTTLAGSSFLFTSANPAAVTFSGNDVAGQFSYIYNGQTYKINGVISRPNKTGNDANGFYFYETTVLGGNTATGRAYLFQIPGKTVDASPTGTSSDPVGTSLEALRQVEYGLANPVITSDGGGTNAYISIVEGTTAVTTVTGTVYGATTINSVSYPASTKTFTITGGIDASKFSINSTTGVLTFLAAPDFENPTDAGINNVYDVQVTLIDSQGTTDIQNISVTVTNTNDNSPIITSNGGGTTATINLLTNSVNVTVTATDADYGDVLTYSISGGANALAFTINPNSGDLIFNSPAANGTYYVNVTVTDGNSHTDTQQLTVIVSATDGTPPTLNITSSNSLLSAGETCTIYFNFSEPVQGFTFEDVTLAGGTLSSITQSTTNNTLYTATFTQSGTGTAPSISVGNGTYFDMSNNAGTQASLTLQYDVTPPTVTVTFQTPTISIATTTLTTFTFSEDPGTSFSLSDITVQNGRLTNFSPTADPIIWQATLEATSSVNYPIVTVNNLSYTDLAGNPGSSASRSISLAKPTIDLNNDATSDTGYSTSDNITSNNGGVSGTQLLITGKAPNTSSITIVLQHNNPTLTSIQFDNISVLAADSTFSLNYSNTAASFGTKPVGGLPNDTITILMFTNQTKALSDFSTPMTSNTFIVDKTSPTPIPTVTSLSTYDQTPTITGTATVADGETLSVLVNSVTYTLGNGLSLAGTNWTLVIPIANRISAGTYSVTATVTDAAGNSSVDITSSELTINPSSLSIDLENTAYSDTGASSSDNITTNKKPIITGTATGSDVSVKISITANGITYTYNTVAISGGTFSLNLNSATPNSIIPTGSFPSEGLPAGVVNLTVEGNTSGSINTNTFTIIDLQTSNIITTPTFTTALISWTNGSRSSRVVFMKEGTGAITNPVNLTTYTASNNWNAKGTQLGTSGYYCIYNGSDAVGSVLVTNLYPGYTYTIQAFEYFGNSSNENYLTSLSGTNNPNTVIPWPTTTFTNSNGVSTPEAWSTQARWDHDTIPSANLHPAVMVYIDGNCDVTDIATTHNLTILAPHDLVVPKVTIQPEKLLQVTGNLGGQLINNGGASALTIKAHETLANGSLTYASGTPEATVEMYSKAWWNLNEVINSKYNWQFISIPVVSVSNVNTIFDGGYVRVHNEAGWGAGLGDVPLKRWTQLPSGASMQNDKCYEIVQPSPRFFTYSGTLYNGNISKSLTYTPKITNVQGEYPGQHLIANPYTAAIDISQIQFGANMEETVYIYNTGTFNSWGNNKASSGINPGQYVSIPKNIATQTTPIGLQRQIPSMQAFLVKCTAATTIDINYSSAKTRNTETQRAKQENALPWLRIELKGATKGGDMLWLLKKDGTSREFDNGWDGYKINGDLGMPRLFDSETISNYQVNTLPDFNETKLGFRAGNGDTEYSLSIENYNIANTYDELYLLDKNTNQLIDIRYATEYNFTATNTSTTEERFKILTYRPVSTSTTNINANIFYYDSKVHYQNFTGSETTFNLYDVNGRLIISEKLENGTTNSINVKLPTGVYLCKILTKNQYVHKSIIVN